MTVVEFADADPQGLTLLLGELIAQNLERDPSRRRLMRGGVVVIAAVDAGVATTLRFGDGSIRVEGGGRGDAPVVVAGDSELLFQLVACPLRLSLPDILSADGRAVTWQILTGRVRVKGLLRHAGLVRRLTMLLSSR